MSRKENDGKNKTHGFGGADTEYVPDSTVKDPGPRDLNDPTWVVRDRRFKEFGAPRTKYY